MSLTRKDLMLISPHGEKIARENRTEGLQEGQLVSARRDLGFVVNARFPGLLDDGTIGGADLETVRALFEAPILAPDRAAAETASAAILRR
ncbi:MAG: hypothetical protein R2729_29585 [Bryobacteraceae bacterium]